MLSLLGLAPKHDQSTGAHPSPILLSSAPAAGLERALSEMRQLALLRVGLEEEDVQARIQVCVCVCVFVSVPPAGLTTCAVWDEAVGAAACGTEGGGCAGTHFGVCMFASVPLAGLAHALCGMRQLALPSRKA